jgi:hypothetical protein
MDMAPQSQSERLAEWKTVYPTATVKAGRGSSYWKSLRAETKANPKLPPLRVSLFRASQINTIICIQAKPQTPMRAFLDSTNHARRQAPQTFLPDQIGSE